MKTSPNNHENIFQKSSTNLEQIIQIPLKSLKTEEKTCFPLQPEAHFFQPLQEHLYNSATIRTTINVI